MLPAGPWGREGGLRQSEGFKVSRVAAVAVSRQRLGTGTMLWAQRRVRIRLESQRGAKGWLKQKTVQASLKQAQTEAPAAQFSTRERFSMLGIRIPVVTQKRRLTGAEDDQFGISNLASVIEHQDSSTAASKPRGRPESPTSLIGTRFSRRSNGAQSCRHPKISTAAGSHFLSQGGPQGMWTSFQGLKSRLFQGAVPYAGATGRVSRKHAHRMTKERKFNLLMPNIRPRPSI